MYRLCELLDLELKNNYSMTKLQLIIYCESSFFCQPHSCVASLNGFYTVSSPNWLLFVFICLVIGANKLNFNRFIIERDKDQCVKVRMIINMCV